eukprot:gene24786-10269_t
MCVLCKEVFHKAKHTAASRKLESVMKKCIDAIWKFTGRHVFEGEDSELYWASWYLLPTAGEGDKEPFDTKQVPPNILDITIKVMKDHMDEMFKETLKGPNKMTCKEWYLHWSTRVGEPSVKAFLRAGRKVESYPCSATSAERPHPSGCTSTSPLNGSTT